MFGYVLRQFKCCQCVPGPTVATGSCCNRCSVALLYYCVCYVAGVILKDFDLVANE